MSDTQQYPATPLHQTRQIDNMASFNAYATVELSDGQAANVQLTMRHGMSADAMTRDFGEYVKFLNVIAMEHGAKFDKRPPMAPPPAMPPAAQQAMAEGDKATAQAIYDQDVSITPPPAGKEYLTMSICKIVVRPEPDGTYSLECYAPGHKWPDLKATKRKLEVVKGYIKHITSADASKPLELSVNAIAYYCEGKPKDNGGYWLDLYHLRLA